VNSLGQLLEFILGLQEEKISFNLQCVRDAIMVVVPTPSKCYEVEFFEDGHIEAQTFGPPSDVRSFTLEEITNRLVADVNG
jgi:hypothetical protein